MNSFIWTIRITDQMIKSEKNEYPIKLSIRKLFGWIQWHEMILRGDKRWLSMPEWSFDHYEYAISETSTGVNWKQCHCNAPSHSRG